MRLSARTLVVREDAIAAGRVLVSADDTDRPTGVACVAGDGEIVDLDDLFVDPPAIGSGAGRALRQDGAVGRDSRPRAAAL
jgi:hypothetical protein